MEIRSLADAKAAVAAYSDALERGDYATAAEALRAINEVSPQAADAVIRAAVRQPTDTDGDEP